MRYVMTAVLTLAGCNQSGFLLPESKPMQPRDMTARETVAEAEERERARKEEKDLEALPIDEKYRRAMKEAKGGNAEAARAWVGRIPEPLRNHKQTLAVEAEISRELKREARDAANMEAARIDYVRKGFAEHLNDFLTKKGIEADVRADGTTLRIHSFACGKVLYDRLFGDTTSQNMLDAAKFKHVVCDNGLQAWTWN